MTHRRLTAAFSALSLVAVLGACGADPNDIEYGVTTEAPAETEAPAAPVAAPETTTLPPLPSADTLTIANFAISPFESTADAGDRITIQNDGELRHVLLFSDRVVEVAVDPGESVTIELSDDLPPGAVVTYYDLNFNAMAGSIVVG
jgi:hypothetical protein